MIPTEPVNAISISNKSWLQRFQERNRIRRDEGRWLLTKCLFVALMLPGCFPTKMVSDLASSVESDEVWSAVMVAACAVLLAPVLAPIMWPLRAINALYNKFYYGDRLWPDQ